MTFRVGMRVVCVDDKNFRADIAGHGHYIPFRPVRGNVYTVRGFCDDGEGIYLEEIRNPTDAVWLFGIGEGAFLMSRFRPLVEDKSSTFFTEGAPKDSEQFDNRRKIGVVA